MEKRRLNALAAEAVAALGPSEAWPKERPGESFNVHDAADCVLRKVMQDEAMVVALVRRGMADAIMEYVLKERRPAPGPSSAWPMPYIDPFHPGEAPDVNAH